MKLTDDEIFEFIFERLVNVYGENRNYDYMKRFREAIENHYQTENIDLYHTNIMKFHAKQLIKGETNVQP